MNTSNFFVKILSFTKLLPTQIQRDADRRLASQHVRVERASEDASQRDGAAGARVAAAAVEEAE